MREAAQCDLMGLGPGQRALIAPGFFEASTSPFEERVAAQDIMAILTALAYTEFNAVVQAIDISPGESVRPVA